VNSVIDFYMNIWREIFMFRIGVVGLGAICGIYLENINKVFKGMELVAGCDLDRARADKVQKDHGIPRIYDTMHELFADKEVDIVLNLTRPYEHYEVNKAALLAGKHVYTEKPLAASFEEGKELVAIAREKGLMLGGAPDTFLGAGIQTCRKIIDGGFIGDVVGAAVHMICRGHEGWHPDPEFYYKHGGGPMLDMGPYYVTALVNLLGGVKGLTGRTKISFPQRTITSAPKNGTVVTVDVPTYITGIMDFDSGAIGTIFTTFDAYSKGSSRFEVYGSEGTLYVPDPNTFGGPIMILRQEERELKEIPLMFDYAENSRGIGLADMAKAITDGRVARADYAQILHVLEIMTSFEKSSNEGRYVELESRYERRPAMVKNALKGVIV